MKRILLNDGWRVEKGTLLERRGGSISESKNVTLPYDAMIHEIPSENTKSGAQTGFYPGGEYTYTKMLDIPKEWEGKAVKLFFGGVYRTARVKVNGDFAGSCLHGYGEFYVDIDKFLNYGQKNEISVVANNTAEPNCRWFTGSGIYRNVELLTGEAVHIAEDGVRVTTKEASEEGTLVEIETKLRNISRVKHKVKLNTEVTFEGLSVKKDIVYATVYGRETEKLRQTVFIPKAELWSEEHPALYDICVTLAEGEKELDQTVVRTGLRVLSVDAERGLRINGREVKLRGACIHHDNGILGAATFAAAEKKRARELKEAGFNAIRSAHNPVSREMLSACDEYGILVMDELSDVWNDEKNAEDFSILFDRCWEEEAEKMVRKDYNHPSVIIYSTGNELLDIGHESGGRWNRRLCTKFHELDGTRFTTTGCSGLNAVAGAGKITAIAASIMQEKGIDIPSDSGEKSLVENTIGALNMLMTFMEGPEFTCHPMMTEVLEEPGQAADICGYNYSLDRHVLEKEIHPNKPIVATESFPAQIADLWKTAEEYHHILGDFTWTGYDYIGEAGCGIFYYDGNKNFGNHFPDRLSYIGDINLIGYRRPISYFREIVFGLRKEPYIAAIRVNRYGQEYNRTNWLFKDNISSWTWPGLEGKETEVDIYSCDEEAELFLNDRSLGKKPCGKAYGFIAAWKVYYEPGKLTAVTYKNGKESGRYELKTAGDQVKLRAEADRSAISADGQDIAFVTCRLTDQMGTPNLYARKKVIVMVEGEGTLQGYGNADPQPFRNYDDTEWETYDGEVMAAVRSTGKKGRITVWFSAEGCEDTSVVIETV